MTNAEIKAALECMTALCGPTNRLPTLAALKADRTLRALREAWAPVRAIQDGLIREHGKETDGGHEINPKCEGWADYVREANALYADETEVALHPITLKDIEAGWSRDPETGKKDGLDISPAQLGALVELGCIVDAEG